MEKRVKRYIQFSALISIIVVIIFLCKLFSDPFVFPITKVQFVASYKHLAPKELQDVTTPFASKSFFSLSVYRLRQRLLQLPWVSDVAITRSWPNKLVVKVIEQNAIARWGKHALVSNNGDLFVPQNPDTIPAGLPELNGPAAFSKEMLDRYFGMQSELTKLGLVVKKLRVNSNHAWVLQLSNGVIVYLGNIYLTQRLKRFFMFYPKIVGGHSDQVVSVDLRYKNGLAVKWRHDR